MIILYSITGIITALFLSIIITGAVRAHRHPERYGPRLRPGRPRQSRARGIARAMLETIPIVKFGDENNGGKLDADKDVEMSVDSEAPASQLPEDTRQPTNDGNTSPTPETPRDAATTAAEKKERPHAKSETDATDHPNFSCPICTDDFVKGQDLRVLPCNHQFHPECIDPWLVNVSGTCPLWYVTPYMSFLLSLICAAESTSTPINQKMKTKMTPRKARAGLKDKTTQPTMPTKKLWMKPQHIATE